MLWCSFRYFLSQRPHSYLQVYLIDFDLNAFANASNLFICICHGLIQYEWFCVPPDHCMAPMKIGPCRGSFPRWHYNAASEKCEKFDFGGCRENLNNYLSEVECTNACAGSGTISNLKDSVSEWILNWIKKKILLNLQMSIYERLFVMFVMFRYFRCTSCTCKLILFSCSVFKIKIVNQGDFFHFQRFKVSDFNVWIMILSNKYRENCQFVSEGSCCLFC